MRGAVRRPSDLAGDRRKVRTRGTSTLQVEPINLPGGVRVDRMAAELLNGARNGGDLDLFSVRVDFFCRRTTHTESHRVPGALRRA